MAKLKPSPPFLTPAKRSIIRHFGRQIADDDQRDLYVRFVESVLRAMPNPKKISNADVTAVAISAANDIAETNQWDQEFEHEQHQ